MIDDNDIKRQLHSVSPPENLEDNILKAWKRHCTCLPGRKRFRGRSLIVAAVASLAAIIAILGYILMVPAIVNNALIDIQKDEFVGVGLVEQYRPWLSQKNISLPPQGMTVEASKFCNLSGKLSFHMKIAGKHQGKVHLFILKSGPAVSSWKQSGTVASLSWRIIKPRANLYVLVLFTRDMREESVNKLIQKMFYV